MKKILVLLALVLVFSVSAYAQKAPVKAPAHAAAHAQTDNCSCPKCDCSDCEAGQCDNASKSDCPKCSKHGKYGHGKDKRDVTVTTVDQAKTKINDYIKANLKGYFVVDVKEFQTKRGHKAFTADVKDASGNILAIHVSPFGDVMGPMFKK